jgi:predicted PurR-regulated permease PerM
MPIDLLDARVVQGEERLYLAKAVTFPDSASVDFDTLLTPEHIGRFREAEVETVPVQADRYWDVWSEQFKWLDVDDPDLDSVFGSAGAEITQRLQKDLEEKLSGLAEIAADLVGWLFTSSRVVLSTALGLLAASVLSLIVLAYLLRAFDNYVDVFLLFLPAESWERARNVARGVDHSLQAFLRGQFYIIVVIAVLTTVAYRLAGIPFALLLGIFGGLLNTIPNVGVFLAGGFALIALIVGSITGLEPGILLFIDVGGFRGFLLRAMLIPVALFTVQTIDNSFISPRVMSRALSVDPLLIMFSVLAGGALMGFWGVLLAIPTLVIVKSAWESYDADGIPPSAVDPVALAPRDDEVSTLDDL